MTFTPELGRAQTEVENLRRRLERVEEEALAMEQQHLYPHPRVYVARLQKEVSGTPDRFYTAVEQDPISPGVPKQQRDAFTFYGLVHTDRDVPPQSYATDVAVLQFGGLRVILPTPNKLVPVIDGGPAGPSEAPFTRLGFHADITDDGAPVSFRTALPLMNANKPDQYFPSGGGGLYPYKADNVYVGIHVWPFLDAGGGSSIPGVDKDKGFFIVWTPPPGDLAETLTLTPALITGTGMATVTDGDTVTVKVDVTPPEIELDRDGQGNVLDVRISDAGSVAVTVTSTP